MFAQELPGEWRTVRFGEVVRQVKDRVDPETSGLERYVAGEHMDTDDLRIRRWGTIGDGYLGPAFHMRFKPGQVLYGSRRTYLRKVAVADFTGVCANTTFVVEPSSPELLAAFLPLVMSTEAFHAHSIEQSKGSVNPYINFKDLNSYAFELPPEPEQEGLVALAEAVHDVVDRLVFAHEAAWRTYFAMLRDQQMFPERKRLVDLAGPECVVAGPFGSQLHAADYVADGLPLLNPTDMALDRLKDVPSTRVPREFVERFPQYRLEAGDLVFARRGDLDKRVVIGKQEAGWVLGSDCIRVRFGDVDRARIALHSVVDRTAVSWLLRRSTRTTMPGTNTSTILDLPLRVPRSADLQDVAQVIDSSRELIDSLARAMLSTRHLGRQLIGSAMTGGHRVH